jgi:spore germination protein YaaH
MRQPPGTRFTRRTPPSLDRLGRQPTRLPLLLTAAAALLVILSWVLFLPPFGLLRGGDGWQRAGEGSLVRRRTDVPRPPEGFQLASQFYEIRQDRGVGPATMTIPLEEGKAGRGLALFTYSGGSWRRLAPAEVTADGRAARGQVDQVPDNIAVMRRISGGFQVQGILKPGASLHPDAEQLVTVLSPADYVPAPDGSVNGAPSPRPASDVVAVVPVVSATAGAERDAVNAILASERARAAHVAELVKLVQTHRLDGIDLEYTAIDPNLGGAYLALVTALAEQLHKTGQTLTVTLPLPRREGTNWNTFGYDWKELARVADYVRIYPERDQSIYRRAMREALNYITGVADPKKVILTLSPLATERSEQGTRLLTAVEALSVAAQFTVRDRERLVANSDVQVTADNLNREGTGGRAGLIWDANAAAVSFVYQAGDSLRTVWIENAFSAAFKLEFVHLWRLGGVAVDDASAGEGMANIWPAIAQYQKAGAPTLLQPNGGLLQPQWLVDGQSKEIGKAVFTWKAPPDPGDHTVSLVVGDGVMRVINSQRVTLRASAPASASPAATPARSPTTTR